MKNDDYETIGKIGEGTFGEVFRALHIKSGRVVALKKIRLRTPKDGLPKHLMREIQALRGVEHPNVIPLYDYFPYGSSIVLAFELMETDLHRVMRCLAERGQSISTGAIKSILAMLLKGVCAIHDAHMMHRDLKPANLLFSSSGHLKLGDFGLARVYQQGNKDATYSHEVATRWYRAPELLFGARKYGASVDMWAVGCIFAELITNWPVFPGENDIDQLRLVMKGLGSPTLRDWPEMAQLPDYNKIVMPEFKPQPLDHLVPNASPDALRVLRKMLVFNPQHRHTARQVLSDPYFLTMPLSLHCSALVEMVRLPTEHQEKRAKLDQAAFDRRNQPSHDIFQPFAFV